MYWTTSTYSGPLEAPLRTGGGPTRLTSNTRVIKTAQNSAHTSIHLEFKGEKLHPGVSLAEY